MDGLADSSDQVFHKRSENSIFENTWEWLMQQRISIRHNNESMFTICQRKSKVLISLRTR